MCCFCATSHDAEGIKLLQEGGVPDVDPYGDLNTELERTLGKIVKEKYGTDFYILHRYPMAVSKEGAGEAAPVCSSHAWVTYVICIKVAAYAALALHKTQTQARAIQA